MTDWRTDSEIDRDLAELPGDRYPEVPLGELPYDYVEDCPRCEGQGMILANQYTSTQERTCPNCNGEGYVA